MTVAQLLAPFTPFIADEIYENLDGAEPRCTSPTGPQPRARDLALEPAWPSPARRCASGCARAPAAKVKLRQPLREAVVVAAGAEREAIERLERHRARRAQREGAALRRARPTSSATYELKPNYRTLGPRFGKAMPQVAAAVAALDARARRPRAARRAPGRREHRRPRARARRPTTCCSRSQPLDGYQLEREGSHAVALELAIDEGLRREGLAREIVHAVQDARKDAGLDVEDRIALTLGGDAGLLDAARAFEELRGRRDAGRRGRLRRRRRAARRPRIEGRELRIGVARQPG